MPASSGPGWCNLLTMVATDEHPHFVLRYIFSVPHTPGRARSAVELRLGDGLPCSRRLDATSDRPARHIWFPPGSGALMICVRCALPAAEAPFPSVTPVIPAAHWYEREARDLFGIVPRRPPRSAPAGTA